MPIRNSRPVPFLPSGVTDAVDMLFEGACMNLQNLVFDRVNRGAVVPRPGVVQATNFSGFTSPGVISAAISVGSVIYGLIATGRNPGFDEPFVYDTSANAFKTVGGVQASNVPATQSTSGAWTPPTMDVVGTRVVVSHPGFSGSNFIGWFDISGVSVTPTGNTTSASKTIASVSSTTGVQVGMTVSGAGIPANSYVVSFVANTSVTINNAATATATGVTLTIAGGTAANPLWGAGNTNTNALPSVPQWVRQFYGRAYYGCGNQVWMSDALACASIGSTPAANVLTLGDSASSTVGVGLPLNSSAGGILQSLIVFKPGAIFQITGDPGSTSSPLAQNTLANNIGCQAPRTAVPTPLGVMFIASDGPRLVNLTGEVEYLQSAGNDLVTPFSAATQASRMCAAFNNSTYRVAFDAALTVWNSVYASADYWYDTMFARWNGVQTFAYHLAVPVGATFFVASNASPGVLFQSDVVPSSSTVYTDNGSSYLCKLTSCASKGSPITRSSVIESTIELCSLANSASYYMTAFDDQNNPLSPATISLKTTIPQWASVKFGQFAWRASQLSSHAYQIPWVNPLVFDKMIFEAQVQAAQYVSMKAVVHRVQELRYEKT